MKIQIIVVVVMISLTFSFKVGAQDKIRALEPLPIRRTVQNEPKLRQIPDPMDTLGQKIETLVKNVRAGHGSRIQYVTEPQTEIQVGLLNPERARGLQDKIVIVITGYEGSTPEYFDDGGLSGSYQRYTKPIYFVDANVDPKPPVETAYHLGMAIEKILSTTGAAECVVVCHSKGGVDFRTLVTGKAKNRQRTYDYRHSPLYEKIVGAVFLATPHHGVGLLDRIEKITAQDDKDEEADLAEAYAENYSDHPERYISNQAIDDLFSQQDLYPEHLYMLNVVGQRYYSPVEMDELWPLPSKKNGDERSWRNSVWYKLYQKLGYAQSDGLVLVTEASLDIADHQVFIWLSHDQFFIPSSPVTVYADEVFQKTKERKASKPPKTRDYIPRKPRPK